MPCERESSIAQLDGQLQRTTCEHLQKPTLRIRYAIDRGIHASRSSRTGTGLATGLTRERTPCSSFPTSVRDNACICKQKYQEVGEYDLYHLQMSKSKWPCTNRISFQKSEVDLDAISQVQEEEQEVNALPVTTITPVSQIDFNVEHYISKALQIADRAKVKYRTMMKTFQLTKAEAMKAAGCPLSARERERERSRRESAVTRKRAEVYLFELEQIAKMVPLLQNEISTLRVQNGLLAKVLRNAR